MSDSEEDNAKEEEEDEDQEGSGSGSEQSGSGNQSDGSQKSGSSSKSGSASKSGSDSQSGSESVSGSDSDGQKSKKKKKKKKKKKSEKSQKQFIPKKDCFSTLQSVLQDLDGLNLQLQSFASEMRNNYRPKMRDFSAQKAIMKDQSIQKSNNSYYSNNRLVGPPSLPLQQFKRTPSPTGSPQKYVGNDTQNQYSSAGVSTIRRSISQQRDPNQGGNSGGSYKYKKHQPHNGRFNSSYHYAELPQPPISSQNRPFLKKSGENLYQTPQFEQRGSSNKFSRFKEPPISFSKNPEIPKSLKNYNNSSIAPPLINPPEVFGNSQQYYKSPYNPAQFTGTGGYRKSSPDWHRVGDFYRNQSNFKKEMMRQSFQNQRSQQAAKVNNLSIEGATYPDSFQKFEQIKMPASNQQIESAVNTLLN